LFLKNVVHKANTYFDYVFRNSQPGQPNLNFEWPCNAFN